MIQFEFVDADALLLDSFKLGKKIYESGFIPTHAVSLWRGGTPVGLGVGEYFRLKGHFINHTTFATASYTGINSQSEIIIKGLEHLIKSISKEDKLLIVDDIYDSGKTIEAVINTIKKTSRANSPDHILVACVYNKIRERSVHIPVTTLSDKEDVWISFPHEIADLVSDDDKNETWIQNKSAAIYSILQSGNTIARTNIEINNEFYYLKASTLLEDSLKLAVTIFEDGFYPDFIIATWPGGISAGLSIHEYFKYRIAKDRLSIKTPDHISINTSGSHLSYKSNIIGIKYLEDTINPDDKILLVDTGFGSGRLINHTIDKLKESLRRNINVDNIRIASVYYNPLKDVTWTTVPRYTEPHYYLYKVNKEVIFPHQIHRLPSPEKNLKTVWPELHDVLYK
ncbi:MAG: hypothetical protein A2015_01685 [Spirochaetes bacterium GWF1_31_7]|nr:MAG: hypothetical protein A2Y30_03050 [Spirochaetes bacterium GWE1_32_154]OHD48311.1 MAG: hypothetical protein A2Y29_05565 [Spirochaetes bacterium GWE2_31_10]OHD49299.1 MAG: hypothetical protein A2015_01685 [Spirochaetes bacterium GWF1_31_7]HBD92961.1 hypothetical protein [Spirochaetia bacterium]HBI37624.1 hypothetical protein [Spirochaetia bacterium]